MKNILRPLISYPLATIGLIAFSFMTTGAVAAAVTDELGQPAGIVLIPEGLPTSEVKVAITRALAGRHWIIKSTTGDRVVGYLRHGSNEATLTLVYDTSKVELFCLGWQINKGSGVHEKPEQPERWLKYIRADLPKFFARVSVSK